MLPPAENPLCLGLEGPQAAFLKALRSGRLPHSWIILGPDGVGKRTFCYHLIRVLFTGKLSFSGVDALAPQDPLFRRIALKSHGDLLVLEKKEGAIGLNVDDIRVIKSFLQKTTAEGGWRIILLDGLDCLTRFGANALLKSLEEPPPQTLFFLTAQTLAGIYPTLRSRCQVLLLKPLENKPLKEALKKIGYPSLDLEEAESILPFARGCVGKAIFFLEEARWKKMVLFQKILRQACLSPFHISYQAPFSPENITLFSSESLPFWGEFFINWLEDLLHKEGASRQTLTLEEQEILRNAAPALWGHRLENIKAQWARALQFHLDPLHTLSCLFHLLRS